MEIQTKPLFRVKTPKIKCIISHKNYPNIIACMFTGEINIFDPKTLTLKKSVSVSTIPIRTGVIVPTKDWILLGTDDGTILVLDIASYNIIETIKAHDDFVRKIVVDESNSRFISVSDDNRTKLWSYKDGLVLLNKYKDSKHYVMDACFCPNDLNHFLTVSMDTKVRLYSVLNTKCLKTFKGHQGGINTIDFINSYNFVTGADDLNVIVWDLKSSMPIAVLKGHTGNVNKIKLLKNSFVSCSEDSSIRFWNMDYKCYNIINTQSRAWDLLYKDGKIFIGTDDEFIVYEEQKVDNQAFVCENKILYNSKNTLFSTKIDQINAFKELGTFDAEYTHFSANNNGKLICVFLEDQFTVYSTLGMRKKYFDKGNNLFFLENDSFVYLKDEKIIFVKKFEIEKSFLINNCSAILYANNNKILVVENNYASLFSISGELIHNFKLRAEKAFIIGDFYVLAHAKISVFDKNFNLVDDFDNKIDSYVINDDVLFFNDNYKTNYLILSNKSCFLGNLKYCPYIFGIYDNNLFYLSEGIKQSKIDFDLILYQKNFLNGLKLEIGSGIKEKAISFLVSLKCYDEALELCENENQKFEILLVLGRYEEALGAANSPIKYEKLGKYFYEKGQMKHAAECFYKAGILDSLLLTDLNGDKKYLEYVAKEAKSCGKNNLAFLAAYKNKDFDFCKNLLKDTPFYNAFNEFYD